MLSDHELFKIREALKTDLSIAAVSRQLGISYWKVYGVAKRQSHSHRIEIVDPWKITDDDMYNALRIWREEQENGNP